METRQQTAATSAPPKQYTPAPAPAPAPAPVKAPEPEKAPTPPPPAPAARAASPPPPAPPAKEDSPAPAVPAVAAAVNGSSNGGGADAEEVDALRDENKALRDALAEKDAVIRELELKLERVRSAIA